MSLTAAALRKMADMGLSFDQAIELAEVIEEGFAAPVPPLPDSLATKRAYDRAYRRREREDRTTSYDIVDDIVKKETFPHTPIQEKCIPPSPPKGGSSPNTTFADFWRAYPNKIGKGAAEKSYTKALQIIAGPDPPSVLLSALERVKPTWRDPKYIPHASTWLNQRRWEDEPQTVNLGILDDRRPSAPNPKTIARHENYRASFAGAEEAAERWRQQHGG